MNVIPRIHRLPNLLSIADLPASNLVVVTAYNVTRVANECDWDPLLFPIDLDQFHCLALTFD